LQKGLYHQRSLNKLQLKKILDEDGSYSDYLRDVFPKYYDKSFLTVKKGNGKDFVFFKYSTNSGKFDVEKEKKDLESEE
jgi:NRPS condensation-like uncharacterized protein